MIHINVQYLQNCLDSLHYAAETYCTSQALVATRGRSWLFLAIYWNDKDPLWSIVLNRNKLREQLLSHYINLLVHRKKFRFVVQSFVFVPSEWVSKGTSDISAYDAFVWVYSSTDAVTYLAFHELNESDKITRTPLVEHFLPQTLQTTLQMHKTIPNDRKIQFSTSVLVMHLKRTTRN